ncbi:MAG: glycosyltransferase family 2 protein [Acetobacteraceae bacterium]
MSVACIMMQKDEQRLLPAWLTYHEHLFGTSNLFVYDNGSTIPAVIEELRRFEARGGSVEWSHSRPEDYRNKEVLLGSHIQALQRNYAIVLPLDCDEFIAKRTDRGVTCSRTAVLDYLKSLTDSQSVLRVPHQFVNHPLVPDFYSLFSFKKVFFGAAPYQLTDHGFHMIRDQPYAAYCDTQLVHIHMHNRPFPELLEAAKRKWRAPIATDDIEALQNYQGPSMHLVPYFLMTEQEYYASFRDKVQFYFPAFRRLLETLDPSVQLMPEDAGEFPWGLSDEDQTTMFVPAQFDAAAYLQAHADVCRAGLDPWIHYCQFGFKEMRGLKRRKRLQPTS